MALGAAIFLFLTEALEMLPDLLLASYILIGVSKGVGKFEMKSTWCTTRHRKTLFTTHFTKNDGHR